VPERFVIFACMPKSNTYKQQKSSNLLFTVINLTISKEKELTGATSQQLIAAS
jgi:hypothetical protein